jgi:hypothetical protein
VLGGPSNEAGPGPFPQARVVATAECGTGSILGAQAGGYDTSEIALFRDMVPAGTLGPGMIVIMHRNFRAPRGALVYRPRSGHGLEEVSVGLMAYLDP